MTGTISKMETDRGFGFIRDERGLSRFFSVKHVVPQLEFDLFKPGDPVQFEPITISNGKGNGLRAVEVRRA